MCAGYLFYLLVLIPNIRDAAAATTWWTPVHLRDIRNSHGVGTFDVPAPDNLDSSSCELMRLPIFSLRARGGLPGPVNMSKASGWLANILVSPGWQPRLRQPAWALLYLGVGVARQLINHAIREAPCSIF